MGSPTHAPPYSRTRRTEGLLFTAGILGRTSEGLAEGFRAQLEAAFDDLDALLVGEGSTLADVVRLVCYLTDADQMGELNEVFTTRFAEPRPTRTTVVVAALPFGAMVEVEATAAVADPQG